MTAVESALDVIERIETARYRYKANFNKNPKYVVLGCALVNTLTAVEEYQLDQAVSFKKMNLMVLPVGDDTCQYLGVC